MTRQRAAAPLAAIALALSAAVCWSATLVTPGPGTPLQDAIDAAAPGTTLILQPGVFAEAIVIPKPLKLLVRLGGGSIDASATSAVVAVDIQSDGVQLKASGAAVSFVIKGGERGIQVGPYARVKLTAVDVSANAEALVLAGSTQVTAKNSSFSSSGAGPAAFLSGIPLRAKIKLGLSALCPDPLMPTCVGMLISDSGIGATQLGKGGVKILLSTFSSILGRANGLIVENSSGIFVKGARRVPCCGPGLGCNASGCTALSLDATSSLNRFSSLAIFGFNGGTAVSDAGTGNCGVDLLHPSVAIPGGLPVAHRPQPARYGSGVPCPPAPGIERRCRERRPTAERPRSAHATERRGALATRGTP